MYLVSHHRALGSARCGKTGDRLAAISHLWEMTSDPYWSRSKNFLVAEIPWRMTTIRTKTYPLN